MPLDSLLLAASLRIDPLFASVDHPDRPGCALDVRQRGDVIVQRAYGQADLAQPVPITQDTVFEAGSVSKQFTAALILLLAERGALGLDDSVRRWLPELSQHYQPVTLAMLLHHTGGVRDWSPLAELSGWPRGTRHYTMEAALRLIGQQEALHFPPGSEYLYSNSHYVLAARVAERASGRSLQALSQAELFGPLGMAHTRWRTDFAAVVPRRAQAYSPADGADAAATTPWRLDMPFEDVVGPGGLLSTVEDLQRWNAALARPESEKPRWMSALEAPGRLPDGTRVPYGGGLELSAVAGQPAISHAGATAGYRAWLGRFPVQGVSIALLCNAGNLNTEELGPELAAVFLPAPVQADPPPATQPGDTTAGAVAQAVAGLYRNPANDAAVGVTLVTAPAGARVKIGSAHYRATAPGTLETDDGLQARVLRDAAGQVIALQVPRPGNAPVRLERTEPWQPVAADLAAVAGVYRSAELEGEHRLVAAADGLHWLDPAQRDQTLSPVYPDAFRASDSGWTLRLFREPTGQVSGFEVSIGRARHVRFERVPP